MAISPINLFEDQLQAIQLQKFQDSNENKVQAETYNVRTAYANDPGAHNWKSRCGEVLKMIDGDMNTDHGNPLGQSDFVSIQEAEKPEQWQYLVDQMKDRGYSYVPQGEQGSANGNILFYKSDTWQLEGSGGEFNIKSDDWQRSAIWGHFVNKNTGQEMYSFASHFPRHTGITSLENISEKIDQITNNDRDVPVLFMADTNDKAYDSKGRPSYDSDPAFQNLGMDDTYDKTKPDGRASTDHAWDGVPSHREDMIFARGVDWSNSENDTHILHYQYTDPTTGQVTTPSDHYAVVSDLYFKAPSTESANNISGLGNIAELQKEMDEVSKNSMDDHPCTEDAALLFGGQF